MIGNLRVEPPVVKEYSKTYYSFHPPAHISIIPPSFSNARPQPDMLGWGQISDPFGKGWLIKVKTADAAPLGKLMDAKTYDQKYPV
jgi:hypothetical protein